MLKTYFKFRNKFDFSPHRFEIGNPIIQTWYYNQNFLFNKIRDLSQPDWTAISPIILSLRRPFLFL